MLFSQLSHISIHLCSPRASRQNHGYSGGDLYIQERGGEIRQVSRSMAQDSAGLNQACSTKTLRFNSFLRPNERRGRSCTGISQMYLKNLSPRVDHHQFGRNSDFLPKKWAGVDWMFLRKSCCIPRSKVIDFLCVLSLLAHKTRSCRPPSP